MIIFLLTVVAILILVVAKVIDIIEEMRWSKVINCRPSEDEIAKGIDIIKAEERYKRMFVTPPPLISWIDIPTYKTGNNQKEIDRWYKEHFDWLEKN